MNLLPLIDSLPSNFWGLIAFLVIVGGGVFGNIKLIKAEIGKDLEKFKNDIRDSIGASKERQNDIESRIRIIQGTLSSVGTHFDKIYLRHQELTDTSECLQSEMAGLEKSYTDDLQAVKTSLDELAYLKDVIPVIQSISVGVENMKKTLGEHGETLQEYADYKKFRRKIRSIFVQSTHKFRGIHIETANTYLCFVCEQILRFVATVEKEGLESLTDQSLEAMVRSELLECQAKFYELYPRDLANKYFTNELSVLTYKEDMLRILKDKDSANGIYERYVSATVRWCQELCANFVNVIIINRGEG